MMAAKRAGTRRMNNRIGSGGVRPTDQEMAHVVR